MRTFVLEYNRDRYSMQNGRAEFVFQDQLCRLLTYMGILELILYIQMIQADDLHMCVRDYIFRLTHMFVLKRK